MPNWCYNRLRFYGTSKEVDHIFDFISSTDEEGRRYQFDFNKIKPMPEGLIKVSNCQVIDDAKKVFKLSEDEQIDFIEEYSDKYRLELTIALDNLKTYGFTNWYDWCTQNWGTKWGALIDFVDRNQIKYDTPWAPPIPILKELSRKFPNVKLVNTSWIESDPEIKWIEEFMEGIRIKSLAITNLRLLKELHDYDPNSVLSDKLIDEINTCSFYR